MVLDNSLSSELDPMEEAIKHGLVLEKVVGILANRAAVGELELKQMINQARQDLAVPHAPRHNR